MGVLRQHHRRLSSARTALALLFFVIASSAIAHSHFSPIHQLERKETEETKRGNWFQVWEKFLIPRRVARHGSSPPTCQSKCGNCSPCEAVRVRIQTHWKILNDYYAEAWRCKCGNKYFMP
ncbi:EPIDERMAL PATTERNING FACTOR-like protein 4 isoform X2 [Macadamia integrifolia]|uniref:EPIDERMAL PATTERNING FACTOR-like protein 4 isoform X2 n=1 Tax=Macadamia integrifolia TaxID=60698 RepID=UPI001C4F9FA7|nr:EPIDERMAL PATTERNING FACTOR-like protein 4 isoform X2 [Macadamia integrifolia]